jgi:hypothetical protein
MMRNKEIDVFAVTHKNLEKSFNKINGVVFDGLLDLRDLDEIDIDFLDTEWGYCIEEDGEIVLGVTDEFPSKKEFEDTLCHEMIHLYQIISDLKVDHGKVFKSFEKHANNLGFNVD